MSPLLTALLACRSPDPDPHRPHPTPTPPFAGGLGGSAETYAVLDAIAVRYGQLRASLDAEAARAATVEEVNGGWDGADRAAITDDGYTLEVTTDEGVRAAVITYEELADGEPGERRSALPAPRRAPGEPARAEACDPGVTCPRSHTVRIVDAAALTNPGFPRAMEELVADLVRLGWREDEIEVVERGALGQLLDPDALLDVRGEGLVVYVGHGGQWSIAEDGLPGEHYLQLTTAGDYTGIMDPARQAQLEGFQGSLVTAASIPTRDPRTGEYTDVTSHDALVSPRVFDEMGLVDPGTMFMVVSCNSDGIDGDLVDAGFGSVVSWQGKTNVDDAREANVALLEAMLAGKDAEAAREGLTEAQLTTAAGASVQVTTDGRPAYFPGWGEIRIEARDLPPGTERFDLVIPRDGEPLRIEGVRPGEAVQVDGIPPIDLQAMVRPQDGRGRPLETRAFPLKLRPGPANDVTFAGGGAGLGLTLVAEPVMVAADGVAVATVTGSVHTWRPSDGVVPTGPAVDCVEVELDSDLGEWRTPERGLTGRGGTFAAELASDAPGVAAIHGLLPEDGVEATRPATVWFGVQQARTGVIFPDGNPYLEPGQLEYAYDSVFVIDETGAELCAGTWTALDLRAVSCPECDRAWSLSRFSGFREAGGSCAPFGYAEGSGQPAIRYGVAASYDTGSETLLDVLLGVDPELGAWVPIGHATYAPRYIEGEGSFDAWDYVTDWGAAPWL